MTERTLARLVAAPDVLHDTIATATLTPDDGGGPYYDEILLRVREDCVETPAGSTTTSVATYCSASQATFEELSLERDDPVLAIFDIAETLAWIDWLPAAPVTVEFVGDPEAELASHLLLRADGLEVRIDCYRSPSLLEQITMELPARFEDDERFVLESGERAPLRAETTAAAMRRIATGVDVDQTIDRYPFVVRDGRLRLHLEHGGVVRASGELPGTVHEGPDVENEYGEGFPPVFETLEGDLEVQTAPDQPLVVVDRQETATLRYVVMPIVW